MGGTSVELLNVTNDHSAIFMCHARVACDCRGMLSAPSSSFPRLDRSSNCQAGQSLLWRPSWTRRSVWMARCSG